MPYADIREQHKRPDPDPRLRPWPRPRPSLRSGQTLIRSDNHGVPPKGMNCNFLFRGINCRACRSVGWLCSCGFQFLFPLLLLPCFAHNLKNWLPSHCFCQALCIYVSYLFIYLKHCAFVIFLFSVFCTFVVLFMSHVHPLPLQAEKPGSHLL